mmetsp:Transcript_22417/g.52866  ORF Transcript_22417/g.52866 Transcript_22417/m.52866 type:complete len:286 (-) Transcript_22417:105-962(-)
MKIELCPPIVTKSRLLPRTLRQLDSPLQVTSSHRSNRQTQRLSMKPVLFFVALSASAASAVDEDINHRRTRAKASKENTGTKTTKTLVLDILNESFNQPFSPFFVMVHNSDAEPLYVRGQMANEPLALLAENGTPGPLVDYYTKNSNGVKSVEAFADGVPYFGGESLQIMVEVSEGYPLVTVASMAINTNDGFVALNGVEVRAGLVIDEPGLDAGSEENNEDCDSIPGPACADIDSGNERSGNGEGFVHVHRGFHGVGRNGLEPVQYDWRNPMMRVSVRNYDYFN